MAVLWVYSPKPSPNTTLVESNGTHKNCTESFGRKKGGASLDEPENGTEERTVVNMSFWYSTLFEVQHIQNTDGNATADTKVKECHF